MLAGFLPVTNGILDETSLGIVVRDDLRLGFGGLGKSLHKRVGDASVEDLTVALQ